MTMKWQGRDRVHLRAGTQVVAVTGRYLFLGKGNASGLLCVHTPADEWKGNCACYAKKEEIN